MIVDNGIILENYLHLAIGSLVGANIKPNHINFRCNVCGDGKNKNNKRGHLRNYRSPDTFEYYWSYKCFNEGDCPCAGEGKAWSGERWLQFTSPTLYNQYIREILKPINEQKRKKAKEERRRLQEEFIKEKQKRRKENIIKENKAIKYFLALTSKNQKYKWLIDKAVNLCIERKIPEDIWKKWYVAYSGFYKDRLVIPFYSNNGAIYYYQCRDLVGNTPKYLNRIQDKDKAIYNIDNINKSKPVIMLEGVIDSLFVENSMAMIGVALSKYVSDVLETLDDYYLLDNDKAGKERSKKLLSKGKKVFLWAKWKYNDCKDINEIVIKHGVNNFTFSDLKDMFTDNEYDKLYLE